MRTDRRSRRDVTTWRLRHTDVLGVRCFRGTLDEATAGVVSMAVEKPGGYACFCNVHVLETAQRDAAVMAALAGARVVFPDGAPLVWMQRWSDGGPAERVGGPDLMESVVRQGRTVNLRHALYGSTPSTLADLETALKRRHPGARIVASIAPPFGSRTEAEVSAELVSLRAAEPDVVWVALGAPRQELWAARYAAALSPALVIGVGAAFDFIGGRKRRAPVWMQRTSLEWLHRLLMEPRRLARRYLVTNSRFLLRAGSRVAHDLVRRQR